jgi:hypothetical protein
LAAQLTDAQARVMKMADGGFRPAYNVQFATDTKSTAIIAPSASMPAARQNRSKLADTSSQALPTAPIFVEGNTVGVVLILVMALLSFRGISTPSLPA